MNDKTVTVPGSVLRNQQRRSAIISVVGFDVFVEIDGDGPYMIMTHGLGANTNVFYPLMEIFYKTHTVVRIDWPGHGHSSLNNTTEKVTMPILVAILRGVMDHLTISSAILVGHSAGGIVSMMFAAQFSGRVDALFVIGAGRTRAVECPAKSFTLQLSRAARSRGLFWDVDERVDYNIPPGTAGLSRALLRAVTSQTNPEGYAQMCDALCDDTHVDPNYSSITCPTCVIGGLADNISPVHVTDELVGLIANSGKTPLRYLLNTGHMIIIEDVHGTALAINRLLEKLR
ncbi:Alpha/beta hydrolase fold-1 [Penicillium crustosum]|uniref:Alpha/beta hydrolase fold-1 n=1 Tax=Penicillium crustosum TaxID=36656 RepID=UPI002382A103|nr:Alpha/beta hydrolase fold-1 [Penicillium crustosum]XP_056735556.1 Alpha/beta hydrolase fold-1 [Penicillium crustosum]KAJ5419426.1 Alpha/beta hydrolase fold-1 [Penicillium crustosum]KAJ5419475.1 Alpha/beta hydrolase fold-1 [Penicillium crustosum]